MSTSTVVELVSQLRDDGGKIQPLLRQLDDLANRMQIADFHNPGNNASVGVPSKRVTPYHGSFHKGSRRRDPAGGSAAAPSAAPAADAGASPSPRGSMSGAGPSARNRAHWYPDGVPAGVRPAAVQKVDDAQLPIPPDIRELGLPAPEASHDWEALQEAVNSACVHFTSPSAKVTWKKWALNPTTTSLVVSLFWWVIAHVFQPSHPQAAAIEAFAFAHFSRQYVSTVLQYRGVNKDLYHDLWQKVIANAVINLLKEAYPRSAHKFDATFEKYIATQLLRWTAGSLPADTHPSLYSVIGSRVPAALVHDAANQAADNDWAVPPPPPPIPGGDASSPSASLSGGPSFVSELRKHHASTSANGAVGPEPAGAEGPKTTTLTFTRDGPGGAAANEAGTGGGPSATFLTAMHALEDTTREASVGPRSGAAAGGGSGAMTAAGTATASAIGFHTFKASPVMDHLLKEQGVLDARAGNAAQAGRRTDRVGGGAGQGLRRPLDEEPGDDVSYRALARECRNKAQEAVARYEDSKRAAAREVASIRHGWVRTRESLDAQATGQLSLAARAKDLSDRLSHYIENDIDRLLRETAVGIAPTSFPVQAPAKAALLSDLDPTSSQALGDTAKTTGRRGISAPASLPAYLASTSAQPGCLAGRVASGLEPAPKGPSNTRIMAPWFKMRGIEAGITAATGQGRFNSTDVAARVQIAAHAERERREGVAANTVQMLIPEAGDGPGASARIVSGAERARGVGVWEPKGTGGSSGGGGAAGSGGYSVGRGTEKRWRPAPIESTRGTLDTRVSKAARAIMRGIDLESYKN